MGSIFFIVSALCITLSQTSPAPQRQTYYSSNGYRGGLEPAISSTYAPATVQTIYSDSTVSPARGKEAPSSNAAQQQQVKILKQINKLNDDGSYTFGYEAADGSFKVETRDNLGNVKGKFGFLDAIGDLKTVEYTAGNGTGFAATGDYIPAAAGGTLQSAEQYSPRPPTRQYQQPQYSSGRQVIHASPSPPPQYAYTPSHAPSASPSAYQYPQQYSGYTSDNSGDDGGQVNYDLDGFSEDADQDGFVDPHPTGPVSPKQSHTQTLSIPKGTPSPAVYQQYNLGERQNPSQGYSLPQIHQQQAQAGYGANDASSYFSGTPFNFQGGQPIEVQVFPGPPPKDVQPIHPQTKGPSQPAYPQNTQAAHIPQQPQYNFDALGGTKAFQEAFPDFGSNGLGAGISGGLPGGFRGGAFGGPQEPRPFEFRASRLGGGSGFPARGIPANLTPQPSFDGGPGIGGFQGPAFGGQRLAFQGYGPLQQQSVRAPSQFGPIGAFRQGGPAQFQLGSPPTGQGYHFQSPNEDQQNNYPQASQPNVYRLAGPFPFQARHATEDARDPRISNRPLYVKEQTRRDLS